MSQKSQSSVTNTLTIILIIATILCSYLAYVKEGHYFWETLLGSMLFAAPLLFWTLLVLIRINWAASIFTGLFKFSFLVALPLTGYSYLSTSTPEGDIPKEGLRIATYNALFYTNENMEERVETLLKVDADILSVLEVNPVWENVFAEYDALYPYQYIIQSPQAIESTAPTMILSKYQILSSEELDSGFIVNHRVQVATDTVFNITQTHPVPPLWRKYTERRNLTVETLEDAVTEGEKNTFVLGDFNTVQWHNPLKSVMKRLNLNLATEGMLTWPAVLPVTPLDHIYVSKDVQFSKKGKVCMNGSDHCLVYIDVIKYIDDE